MLTQHDATVTVLHDVTPRGPISISLVRGSLAGQTPGKSGQQD